MSESLMELCKHNVWASERLFDACEDLSDAQLDATSVGGYGSIRSTLMHIAGAQERCAVALAETGPGLANRDRDPFPGLDVLRDAVRASGETLLEVAARETPGQTATTVWRGETFTMPVWLLLAQAIMHATEHRTQIAAMLTQQGITPPPMDVWTYHEDRFNGDWSQLWSG